MKKTIIITLITLLFVTGCSQYNDPEIAKKIAMLESKENLDEFDKMELKDLKEQGKYDYGDSSSKSCKF